MFSSSSAPSSRKRLLSWVAVASVSVLLALLAVAETMIHRAGPILKGRVVETLSAQFNSRVELDNLSVSVLRGLEVSGDHLRIYAPDSVVTAGATQPLIA